MAPLRLPGRQKCLEFKSKKVSCTSYNVVDAVASTLALLFVNFKFYAPSPLRSRRKTITNIHQQRQISYSLL